MKKILFILMLVLCIGICSAVPTTDAVTGVTTRSATLNAAGGVGTCWYTWGGNSVSQIYKTTNSTCGSSYTINGAPLLTSSTYYVRNCDSTGCGNTVSFVTPAATISGLTYYGTGVVTMFESGMNVTQVMGIIITPYTNTMTAPVTWGMLFLFIFLGLWIKPKDITIPLILAFIAGGAIWSGTAALGIPPEFESIGQGLMYAALAGLVFSWFTK